MQQGLNNIETILNGFMNECNKKAFRNKESISWLHSIYKKLLAERIKLIVVNPSFPADTDLNNIIGQLDKLMQDKISLKQLEWNFYHYTDLFKFKAEDITLDILKEKDKVTLEQQALSTARSQALNSLFKQDNTIQQQSQTK